MRARSGIALLLIGASVAGSAFMAVVATQNFYTIDRLLASVPHESFEDALGTLGSASARDFLRYLASELNRLLFQVWGWTDLALLGSVLGLLWQCHRRWVRYAALGAFVLAAVMIIGLTPPIVSIGRDLDFVPREPPPPGLATFGLLHAAYSVVDVAKLILSIWIAAGLTRFAGTPPTEITLP